MEKKYYELTIPIKPVAKGRPRFSRFGGAYTPQKTREFEAAVREAAKAYCDKPIEGPVHLSVVFLFDRPKTVKRLSHTVKPDLDNLLKGVSDALNGIWFHDDAQIIQVMLKKAYATEKEPAGIKLVCFQHAEEGEFLC